MGDVIGSAGLNDNPVFAMYRDSQTKPNKSRRKHLWQHPTDRSIRMPEKAVAAVALMNMGISDYEVIGPAVGLSTEEVAKVDLSEDRAVRRLGLEGIPPGVYFRLRQKVRCPSCDATITIAPCVACSGRRA